MGGSRTGEEALDLGDNRISHTYTRHTHNIRRIYIYNMNTYKYNIHSLYSRNL